ncbi:MAG: diaminopimelate dehydrogenase [bacterium]
MCAIRVAIVGYGNVGRGVHRAVNDSTDLKLAGILTRGPERVKNELKNKNKEVPEVVDAKKEQDFARTLPADVAVLCGGSKNDLPEQGPLFARYYNTVDSFDTHGDIPDYYEKVGEAAEKNGNLSIVSTGWDPGTFSLERVLGDAFLPGADNHTFWGPGVSQGHSDATRQVKGVKDARQYTLPEEEVLENIREGERPNLTASQKHRRLVYVVPEEGANKNRIKEEIKNMPEYFEPYETEVRFIDQDEMEAEHADYPHGGAVLTAGETAPGNSAMIEYSCQWASNPEATARILAAHARAAFTLNSRGESGARTILEIPPADLSPHSRQQLLEEFM